MQSATPWAEKPSPHFSLLFREQFSQIDRFQSACLRVGPRNAHKTLVKIEREVLEICSQTDKHTDTQTDTMVSILRSLVTAAD